MPEQTVVAAGATAASPSGRLRGQWRCIFGLYGVIALLHALGWSLCVYYSAHYPALIGMGLAAYLFGLRHAFDVDHIAAVDDTVRYLMQRGQRPLGVGFFFSLGHSTVVFALALALALMTAGVRHELPMLQDTGALIGAGVSGFFLCVVGALNLLLLLDIAKVWRAARRGGHSHTHLEELLGRRGLLNRLLGRRLRHLITRSWQIYPVGLLFGLGFDTASEVALLAMAAGAAAGDLPVAAVVALPLLFAAGMTAMDTTDGILMTKAYDWAFVNPLRKIFYNLVTTGLSVALALVIGTVELAQVAVRLGDWHGPAADRITAVGFADWGYYVVAVFMLAWLLSLAVWRLARFDRRPVTPRHHSHEHSHGAGALRHRHRHSRRCYGFFGSRRITPTRRCRQ